MISLLGGIATAGPWAPGGGGCKEHWTQYVETASANAHSVASGNGGQLEHSVGDFTKTSSSNGFGNCWEWDLGVVKTGLLYDTSNVDCTFDTSPVRIRFEYQLDGYTNVADSVMTAFLSHNSGASGDLDITSKLLGSSDQSMSTSTSVFGIFFGMGTEATWEGEVEDGDRITLGAQGSTGAFTLTTNGSTVMRIRTLTCAAP